VSCSITTDLTAWPISYADMEPHYTQAEQLYQVRGARGEDPTDPPARRDVPVPALRTSRGSSSCPTTFSAAGHHPFHAPAACLRDEANPRVQRVRAMHEL
jgi:choline dehydrogenase-like flavoprotein